MLLVVNEQLTCQHIFPDKSLNAHTRRIHINLCKEAKTKHRVAISVWLLAKLELCTICCSDGLQLHSMRACIQTEQQYKRVLVIGQPRWSLHRGGRSAAGEGHTHLLQVNWSSSQSPACHCTVASGVPLMGPSLDAGLALYT